MSDRLPAALVCGPTLAVGNAQIGRSLVAWIVLTPAAMTRKVKGTKKPSLTGALTIKEKQRLAGEVFRRRNLDGLDLRGANLSDARFENVSLRGADFTDANLTGAAFHWCDLRQADFSGARLDGNSFTRSTVRGARGLDSERMSYLADCGATLDDEPPVAALD